MEFLKWIDRQTGHIASAGRFASSFLLIMMVILICIEVLGRYFLSFSTLIADEYSAYFFVGCIFFGFVHSFRNGHFLRVNVVVNRLSERYRDFFYLVASILGFLLSVILTYEVAILAYVSISFGSVSIQPSATPLFIPQMIMPVGMAAMSLSFLNEAIQTLSRLISSSNRHGARSKPR
jgi:TRAP-type C4-dicarboxylate transport system permease small subunit